MQWDNPEEVAELEEVLHASERYEIRQEENTSVEDIDLVMFKRPIEDYK
jgi:hypothetical protein